MRFRWEMVELTGWIGFILLGLCFARLLTRTAPTNALVQMLVRNHKKMAWSAFLLLSLHGFLACSIKTFGFGRGGLCSSLFTEIGLGLLTWFILFTTCLSSLILSHTKFKKTHLLMTLLFTLTLFIHIE